MSEAEFPEIAGTQGDGCMAEIEVYLSWRDVLFLYIFFFK